MIHISPRYDSGFTRRIVGLPKAESDTILEFLFRQIAENPDFQVRLKWEKDTVAIWDNRVSTFVNLVWFRNSFFPL